jgi:hypothetical protein
MFRRVLERSSKASARDALEDAMWCLSTLGPEPKWLRHQLHPGGNCRACLWRAHSQLSEHCVAGGYHRHPSLTRTNGASGTYLGPSEIGRYLIVVSKEGVLSSQLVCGVPVDLPLSALR